jgi:hypothetical protein
MDESTHSRQRRIQLLVRQNRGQRDFKTYVEELSGLLKVEIADTDRLDLEATDRLFAAHTKWCQESTHQPQHCFQKTWTYEPTSLWSGECARTGGALRGLTGVLFVGPYEYCGAIRVAPERALKVAPSLLDFDGNTLNLAALDGRSGLYLDKFEEHSEWFVELVVWGEWAMLNAPSPARSCRLPTHRRLLCNAKRPSPPRPFPKSTVIHPTPFHLLASQTEAKSSRAFATPGPQGPCLSFDSCVATANHGATRSFQAAHFSSHTFRRKSDRYNPPR